MKAVSASPPPTTPSVASELAADRDERARRVATALELRFRDLGEDERADIKRIEGARKRLLSDDRELELINYGAGSPDARRSAPEMEAGSITHNVVGAICRRASSTRSKALLLYGLVRESAPARALEMGTALGISAAYQATALRHTVPGARLTTLEGAPALAAVARETFASVGLDNVDVRVGRFRDTLPAALAEGPLGYAFVDGHHDEEATLEYFERLLPHAPDSVLVFDDIRWNDRMERAWRRIAADDRIGLAVDLDEYGVVFTGRAASGWRRWWRLRRGG
jgi:predicted O-methyltransferase YrrM